MSAAKKGLGRGFESLIPTDLIDDSFNPNSVYDPTAQQDEQVSQIKTVSLSQLHANPDQPRRQFDHEALEELASSIKEHGLIQPIVVVTKGDGYEIVAGERRFRASGLAGLKEVQVIVRSFSDQQQLEVALIENIQRRDLNAVETATAYAKLRDQFNLTNEQIAARVHKSASAISNTLRLLKLPKEVLEYVADGMLSEGQVRPLIGQEATVIAEVLPRLVSEGWSARKVEQYVIDLKKRAEEQANSSETPNVSGATAQREAIESLKQRFKTGVTIRTNSKGAGKIMIDFKNQEDFERIKTILG